MKWKGKVSGWFYAVTVGIAAVEIPLIVIFGVVERDVAALLINLVVLIAAELLCIPITVHNYVEMQDRGLRIVFGFIQRDIPYSDIAELSKAHELSASLAASLDRVRIECRNNTEVMIAIVEKERFLDEMKKRSPKIVVTE